LLEGFTDDERFKDMIQNLTFGSTSAMNDRDGDNDDEFIVTKKNEKGAIPKLADEHRL
jgi:hypothetical protein